MNREDKTMEEGKTMAVLDSEFGQWMKSGDQTGGRNKLTRENWGNFNEEEKKKNKIVKKEERENSETLKIVEFPVKQLKEGKQRSRDYGRW